MRDLIEEWKQFKWIRADMIPELNSGEQDDKIEIFKDEIEPGDINQGLLDDGYLLSCLASIAERPDRIQKLFVS